ncbi:MAG: hypothetical protein D6806_17480 [Deltaproteobacteria bacterium]|nr:MAG: hypothetical protein D6806_17480 [Deltaproteobacteria bacterium]
MSASAIILRLLGLVVLVPVVWLVRKWLHGDFDYRLQIIEDRMERSYSWDEAVRQLAALVGGTVRAGEPPCGPVLDFSKDRIRARLKRVREEKNEIYIELGVVLDTPSPFSLAVVSKVGTGDTKTNHELPQVRVENGRLAAVVDIRGRPVAEVSRWISDEPANLLRLLAKSCGGGLLVKASRGRNLVRIVKQRWIMELDELIAFTRLGVALAEKLQQYQQQGDEKRVVTATRRSVSICPLCLFEVERGGVRCPSCNSLLHDECWQLNDGCTCGQTVTGLQP